MSDRRSFFCPECKSQAIGALVDKTNIRCDYLVKGWKSVQTGKDKKGEPTFEHIPDSSPGCGGMLRNCVHGNKVCVTCEPQFTKATVAPEPVQPLAIIMRDEARFRAQREQEAKATAKAVKKGGDVPAFGAPGKVQLPFLGDAEPDRYTPPRQRRKKET